MGTVTIHIPDSLADIPAALASLRAQLKAVNTQAEALLGAIMAIQKSCPHPNMAYSRDIDGGSSSHCNTCGYST